MRRSRSVFSACCIDRRVARLDHHRHLVGAGLADTLDHAEILAVGARIFDDDGAHRFGNTFTPRSFTMLSARPKMHCSRRIVLPHAQVSVA